MTVRKNTLQYFEPILLLKDMTNSLIITWSLVVLLFKPEPGLSWGNVEVVVTTPASLKHQIRQEIDSALVNFTCHCSDSSQSLTRNTKNMTKLVINIFNDVADKLDTLQQRLDILDQPRFTAANPATSCAAILCDYVPCSSVWLLLGELCHMPPSQCVLWHDQVVW